MYLSVLRLFLGLKKKNQDAHLYSSIYRIKYIMSDSTHSVLENNISYLHIIKIFEHKTYQINRKN